MSVWRPAPDGCLYVIPDIHGMYRQLQLILKRIIPLRNTGGVKDRLVFLGDYIDRHIDSHKVIDIIIELKEDYPDQVFCIGGNHESLLLNTIKSNSNVQEYLMWMKNGGSKTLYGYLHRNGLKVDNPYLINRHRIKEFIPKHHINFFKSVQPYYETDNFIFVHGGCDPQVPLQKQNPDVLAWDRSMFSSVINMSKNGSLCPWEKIIITGHNGQIGGKPFVHDKFMMLDGSKDEKLYVFEMNTREGFSARKGKKRLVKESII